MIVRRAPSTRTCATCGQPDVCHTLAGYPFSSHKRGQRHRDALAARTAGPLGSPADQAHSEAIAELAGELAKGGITP